MDQDVFQMEHTLTIVEPIWSMLQNLSKTLVQSQYKESCDWTGNKKICLSFETKVVNTFQGEHVFHVIILPVLFCVCRISIHCFIVKLQYNHVLLTL